MPRSLRMFLSITLGIVSGLLLIGGIAVLLQGQPGQLVTITVCLAGLWGAKALWPPAPLKQATPTSPGSYVSRPAAHPPAQEGPYLAKQPPSKPYPAVDDWAVSPYPFPEPPTAKTHKTVNEERLPSSARHSVSYPTGDIAATSLTEPTFVALDVETANESRASICAVGIAHVVDGSVVRQRTWLVQPPEPHGTFRDRNVGIHGITPELVRSHGQPWPQVLPELINEINDAPVVAHNASFDMSVLQSATHACGLPTPRMRYDDSLELARQLLPDLPNHRLPTVAQACEVKQLAHHDAGDDARVCAQITAHLLQLRSSTGSLASQAFHETSPVQQTTSASSATGWDAYRGANHEASPDADPSHPLYGAVIVITGALSTMTRKTAQERIASVGATAKTSITQKTTHLVQGRPNGREATSLGSDKTLKALAMQQDGHPIRIITEDQFLALLDGKPS